MKKDPKTPPNTTVNRSSILRQTPPNLLDLLRRPELRLNPQRPTKHHRTNLCKHHAPTERIQDDKELRNDCRWMTMPMGEGRGAVAAMGVRVDED
ncbi:hypothetical protein E3N88_04397 [Mikania micrantha]|uniref:Uncharacterized protein n=1 Tax=Mikania micrantha TaxID=192012 RepID=A0A5N6PUA2_9ASTR|nr:hypothetical protein E3N88_04397 [Mikania micrantha]